jgi:hypothetical protein
MISFPPLANGILGKLILAGIRARRLIYDASLSGYAAIRGLVIKRGASATGRIRLAMQQPMAAALAGAAPISIFLLRGV